MPTTTEPIFDPAQLQRRTMGDPTLQVEVLSLFVIEAERLMRQIELSTDARMRGDRLRAMVATARNVGARRVAEAARAAETEIVSEQPDLEPLRTAVDEALAYVRGAGI